jgi:23S rRNA pseudouridine1911/1915/1917 synthase
MPRPEPNFTLEILHEDNHCLVVNKPAGLLAQGDSTGDLSLVDLVAADLKRRFHKPGNVFVGLVHRLDRVASGAVLLARTSKGAARLSDQFRQGTVQKLYRAIVEGRLDLEPGTQWLDTLLKDSGPNVVRVVPSHTPGGLEARTMARVISSNRTDGSTLVELRPITGRPHQLRVQLSSRGHPILGDRKYGARSRLACQLGGERIALHASELRFTHPTTREALCVRAPVPADWPAP